MSGEFTDNNGWTHWDGCWKCHPVCAIAKVDALQSRNAELEAFVEKAIKSYYEQPGLNDTLLAEAQRLIKEQKE